MTRNLAQELDEVKTQINELKTLLAEQCNPQKEAPAARPEIPIKAPAMRPETQNPDESLRLLLERMKEENSNKVTYLGVFTGGGQRSSWLQSELDTDTLLRLIENRTAERVLSCIGNNDRLSILLALLREPMSVAALVEKCGYHSTGQVYHHLKPLIAADLVTGDKHSVKGTYTVQPHRIQGIIMLLAGIRDMVNGEYSQGTWGPQTEIHRGATMVDERFLATTEETRKIIETCFYSTEPLLLKRFPSKEKKKVVILKLIADRFTPGKRYREKEVNQILREIYEDYVTIRRYLIEYGFIDRTVDCSEYWRM